MTRYCPLVLKFRRLGKRTSPDFKLRLLQALLLSILLVLRMVMIWSIRVAWSWVHISTSWGLSLHLLLLATTSWMVSLARITSWMRVILLLARGLVRYSDSSCSSPTITGELFASHLNPASAVYRASLTLNLVKAHLVFGTDTGLMIKLLLYGLGDWVLISHPFSKQGRWPVCLVGIYVSSPWCSFLLLFLINLSLILSCLYSSSTSKHWCGVDY